MGFGACVNERMSELILDLTFGKKFFFLKLLKTQLTFNKNTHKALQFFWLLKGSQEMGERGREKEKHSQTCTRDACETG